MGVVWVVFSPVSPRESRFMATFRMQSACLSPDGWKRSSGAFVRFPTNEYLLR